MAAGTPVNCGVHGRAAQVMACVHIAERRPRKLFILPAREDSPTTAWCARCEAARMRDRGWYAHADGVAQWGVICSRCLSVVMARVAAARGGEITLIADDVTTPEQKPG